MKFIELAEKRCSIRGFKPDPIPEELLNEVLQSGNLAPTAKNLQPFHNCGVPDQVSLIRGNLDENPKDCFWQLRQASVG